MRLLFFISFLHLCNLSIAQSAWDIEYFWIDSINSTHDGMLAVIDFAPQISSTEYESMIVRERRNIIREDSVKIKLSGELTHIVEKRTIYGDWGLVREQYLEILTDDPSIVRRVVATAVHRVTSDSINFEFALEYIKKNRKKEKLMSKELKHYWISRSDIDGLLVSNRHQMK